MRCVFSFCLQLLLGTFLILSRVQRDIVIVYIGLHVKYPLFLSELFCNWDFLVRFIKNTQIQNLVKIRQVGAELFHEDGETWRS